MKRFCVKIAFLTIVALSVNSKTFCAADSFDKLIDGLDSQVPGTKDIKYRQSIYKFLDLLKRFDIETFVSTAIANGVDDNINKPIGPILLKYADDSMRNKVYTVEPVSNQTSLVDLAIEMYRMGTGKATVTASPYMVGTQGSFYDELSKKIFKQILRAQKDKIPGRLSIYDFQDFITSIKEQVIKKIPLQYRVELTRDVQDFIVAAKQKGKWSVTEGRYAVGGTNVEYVEAVVNELIAFGFVGLQLQVSSLKTPSKSLPQVELIHKTQTTKTVCALPNTTPVATQNKQQHS
jgi:hypothetical protein